VFGITRLTAPIESLHISFRGQQPERWGGYHDCFCVFIRSQVTLQQFVEAFYTSRLFRVERILLGTFLKLPSSDADAYALARGTRSTFAVWNTLVRTETELLMEDRFGRTRSWFRIQPGGSSGTDMCFGSAVAGRRRTNRGFAMSLPFRMLLGFHVIYSQLLLSAAARFLEDR
jgi:hypothetical protein